MDARLLTLGLLAPPAIAVALIVAARFAAPRPSARPRPASGRGVGADALAGLALGTAFVPAFLGWMELARWPGFPPAAAEHALLFVVPFAALVGALVSRRGPWFVRAALFAGVSAAGVWLATRRMAAPQIERWGGDDLALAVAGFAAAGGVFWWLLAGIARRAHPAESTTILAGLALSSAPVLVFSATSRELGEVALALAIVTAAAGVAGGLLGVRAALHAAAATVASALPVLFLVAYYWSYLEGAWWQAAVITASPALWYALRLLRPKLRRPGVRPALVRIAAVALPCAAVVGAVLATTDFSAYTGGSDDAYDYSSYE